jgi:hypothetical protein
MLNKTFYFILLSLIPLLGFSQANSQYPDSGNKIRLGFQTTADGLIWRDTQPNVGVYQPINNKAAWVVLDTVNNKLYHYKNSAWTLVGGDTTSLSNRIDLRLEIADTTDMLSPYWRSGRFSGVLPVANGGTNLTTLTANKVMVGNGTSGVLTPTNLHWDNTNSRLGIGATSPVSLLHIEGSGPILTMNRTSGSFSNTINFKTSGIDYASIISNAGNGEQRYSIGPEVAFGGFHTFYTDTNERMRITSSGSVGIGTTSPSSNLDILGSLSRLRLDGGGASFQILSRNTVNSSTNPLIFDADTYTYNRGGITRMLLDASGNLLVGNTSSVHATTGRGVIEVNGTTSILGLTINGAAAGYLYHGGTNLSVWNSLNGAIEFGTNNTTRLTIASTGAATFSGALTVSYANARASINSTTATNSAYMSFGNTVNGYVGLDNSTASDFGNGAYSLNLINGGAFNLNLGTSNTTRLTINSVGNVGIGNTTPGSRLVVKGVNNTSGESSLNVTNSSDASLLFVRNDGNVGIGTDNPTFKLDVNGTGRFSGKLSISNTSDVYPEVTTSSVDGDNLLGFSNTADANSGWGIGRRNTGQFWIANYTGNFLSGTRTTPLVIASTGAATFSSSVGIGGATPTTSGSGITFPDTQSASTNVNTLDDYEEGTWTPELREEASNRSPTYSFVSGRYVKIGKLVYIEFGLALSNKGSGSGSGQIRIYGLPYTSLSYGAYQEPNARYFGGGFTTASTTNDVLQVAGGVNFLRGWKTDNANSITGATAVPYTEITNSSFIMLQMYYIAN